MGGLKPSKRYGHEGDERMSHMPSISECTEPKREDGEDDSPPRVMHAVALDIFNMPQTQHEGQKYDQILVCVDQHSGWVVAEPCLAKGFTGDKADKLMLSQWRFFGLPLLIFTDMGQHFVSAWWRTICARLGMDQGYSHA